MKKTHRRKSSRKKVAPAPPQVTYDPEEVKQELEQVEQKITYTLQRIDSSLVNAQYVASGILSKVKTYATETKKLSESLKVWGRFFNTFPSAQAPSFACNSHLSNTLGSSIHMTTSPAPGTSTPVSREFSDLLSKISPPRTTPFNKGNPANNADNKSIESLESLRQISPPLTTPFIGGGKGNNISDYSCQRQLDMVGTATKKGNSMDSPVMSPATQNLVQSERWDAKSGVQKSGQKNVSCHIHVDSEISMNLGGSEAGSPLAKNLQNTMKNARTTGFTPKGAKSPAKPTHTAQKLDPTKFPSVYQKGLGAQQLKKVYDHFVTENNTIQPPIAIAELVERVGSFGIERMTLLLELLISRDFVRSFKKGKKQMYVGMSAEECDDIDLDMSV